MNKPKQQRALVTRAKLLDAAESIIASQGFGALRVEEVVRQAGVAKGTFFAHFRDKDALMETILGDRIHTLLTKMEQDPSPADLETLIARLAPLMEIMTCERYVFDLILRHSGAAAKQEIGPIAETFGRQVQVISYWLGGNAFRKDVPPTLLADGLQAFMIQTMALHFCALHNEAPMAPRLKTYLAAWLLPSSS